MKTQIIDGKEYYLYDSKWRAGEIRLILVLTFMLFSLLGYLLYYMYQYQEEFERDPLLFGAKKLDVQNCFCYTMSGATFEFNQERIWQTKKGSDTLVFDEDFENKLNNYLIKE